MYESRIRWGISIAAKVDIVSVVLKNVTIFKIIHLVAASMSGDLWKIPLHTSFNYHVVSIN